MDPLVESDPRQLGPYKIIARLGSGGMGVVFLGSKGSQRVAVKVMRSSFLDSPTLKTRFEREIATLKKIYSPFVAKYLDSDIEGDLVWHAVEFVNGPTLKEKIENDGPLNEGDWWALYSQMREALKDVHRLGVVHRDLKPANIILSETGVKLIDFGISQDTEATSLTSTGMVAGSPAWLSPEQLEGTEVGPGSDVFSTGSILVYAALGRSPWGNETTMTVPVAYKKILSFDFDLDRLPSAYKDAVSPLLLKKASERTFPDRSLTGKVQDQDPPDEAKIPVASDKKLANENSRFDGRDTVGRGKARLASLVFVGLAVISALLLTVPKLTPEPRFIVEMSFLENFRGSAHAAVRIKSTGDPPGISEVTVHPVYPFDSDCPPQQLFNIGADQGVRTFQGKICVPDKDLSLQFSVSLRTNQGKSVSYLCQAGNPSLSPGCAIT